LLGDPHWWRNHVFTAAPMMIDTINGMFEALAGLFALNHCRVLCRDKAVAGVSIASTVFFACWGVWNLYYYPALGQWLSFAGGLFIVSANAIYISLLVYFKHWYLVRPKLSR
jgi:hypothetical protein